jgi:hypothetical protein
MRCIRRACIHHAQARLQQHKGMSPSQRGVQVQPMIPVLHELLPLAGGMGAASLLIPLYALWAAEEAPGGTSALSMAAS